MLIGGITVSTLPRSMVPEFVLPRWIRIFRPMATCRDSTKGLPGVAPLAHLLLEQPVFDESRPKLKTLRGAAPSILVFRPDPYEVGPNRLWRESENEPDIV